MRLYEVHQPERARPLRDSAVQSAASGEGEAVTLSTSTAKIREHSVRTFDELKSKAPAATNEVMFCSIGMQIMSALCEVAAQLADQNEQMREDREFRRAIAEEQRAEAKKRDEFLASASGSLGDFSKSLATPPPIQPRVIFPNEVVHLGCLIREPDGTYAIASDAWGLVRLEPEEAQRLLALISPPAPAPEGKPS